MRRAPHVDAASRKASARAARWPTRSRAPASAPADIDYINLHGTATVKNDAVEAALLADLFAATTRASSTKGWTGHTLGAAGILEATLTLLAMQAGLVPGTLNTVTPGCRCADRSSRSPTSNARSASRSANSFGFGGNNCILAFGTGSAH